MSPRVRAALIRIAVAVAAIGAVVWWLRERGKSTAAPPPAASARDGSAAPSAGGGGDRVVPVQVATAEKRDVPIWIEGLGTVAAFQQVMVRPQVDGRLDKVLFQEGQAVKKGDVLAQIDPRPFLVQLHQAQGALARDRAQLDAAKRNLERYEGLRAQQLVAQQQVDELAGQVGALEGGVKIDQAQVENAQLQLDYAQVKAPLDGITGVRQVDAGNLVKASDSNSLVVITMIDPAAVIFSVPQDRLGAISAAMARGEVAVEVWNRDNTQQLAKGTLTVLDNQINQATATLRLKAQVPNPKRALWPNAFVKARMLVDTRKDAIVVPAVAIQRGPQGAYVYAIAADRTAALKPVTVALITADLAVIEKGVEGGEQVVTEGANQLRPGGRVEAVEPKTNRKQTGGSAAGPTADHRPAAP